MKESQMMDPANLESLQVMTKSTHNLIFLESFISPFSHLHSKVIFPAIFYYFSLYTRFTFFAQSDLIYTIFCWQQLHHAAAASKKGRSQFST